MISELESHTLVTPLPTVIVDAQTDRITSANALAAVFFDRADLPGAPFSRLVAPGLSELAVFAEEVAYRGTAWTRSLSVCRPDGSQASCEIKGRALTTEPLSLMLVFVDLTEMNHHARQAETDDLLRGGLLAWERAKTFFADLERGNQLILDAAGEGIYGINAEGKTTFVNGAAQDMLGWTSDDLIGRDIHAIIHHHHLNGDHYPVSDCPIYKTFRFEQVHRIEDEVFWRKDGQPIRVEYTSTPIYDHGVLAGAVVIFRDITSRKEQEKKLQGAMAEIADLRDRLEQENAYLQEEIASERAHHDIVGTSAATARVIARLEVAARLATPVLLTGESGSGKSLVASALHKESDRRRRPLIEVKCSAIAPDAMEAELFGQIRGAFAGALRDKPGRLELAHGGILHLDAVDALPLAQQAQMLDALETRTVTRLGDTRPRRVDIAVIASTNRSLAVEVAEGRFREDLYFHLNVLTINCPPLRERPEDIAPLAAHLLKLSCRRLGKPVPIVTEGTIRRLTGYAWPGNVRELANVIERGAILSDQGKLVVELPDGITPNPVAADVILTETDLTQMMRSNIVRCLNETGGRISGADGAAKKLGIKPTTLRSRIEKFGILRGDWG
ncbi:PAS domain S-box-containing protein [Jannaschia faecimaris]|uniref:Nif-specific regulatory protein n=1 Tax=Jannaschia faecimaris TaxID=1244108 RepID=A0A1H3TLL5_9RHOB|nr:sigma 54-interacting transcriptional regulator [Jannaschia faecimaris]SDZ50239.1 PAS domain S-box-containing protein [Jannaschia faecimaris]